MAIAASWTVKSLYTTLWIYFIFSKAQLSSFSYNQLKSVDFVLQLSTITDDFQLQDLIIQFIFNDKSSLNLLSAINNQLITFNSQDREKCMAKILGIEKNKNCQQILNEALSTERHQVHICSSMSELEQKTEKNGFDIGILDLGPGNNTLPMLKKIRELLDPAPIIVTSEQDDPDLIVEAIKAGAYDFIVKPFTREKLKLSVAGALEKKSLKNEINYLRRQQDIIYDLDKIVARTPIMQEVMYWTRKYTETDSNLLLTGETGTGKSFMAGAIHFNSSRQKHPFIKINCANLPETLLESELFGHEKGAFTGAAQTRVGRLEQANGGTVFLDEIGEISPSLQAKFLQVIEEKSFQRLGGNRTVYSDIRIIVATHRNLADLVQTGEFRSDLYYRLNVLNLHIPPLRERRDCIQPLTQMLLEKLSRQMRKKVQEVSPEALNILLEYSWPGNIRELANVLERAILLEDSSVLRAKNIHLNSGPGMQQHEKSPVLQPLPQLEESTDLESAERKTIIQALEDNLWVQKAAAKQLGISPRSLNYKVKKLGITHWRWRKHKKVG